MSKKNKSKNYRKNTAKVRPSKKEVNGNLNQELGLEQELNNYVFNDTIVIPNLNYENQQSYNGYHHNYPSYDQNYTEQNYMEQNSIPPLNQAHNENIMGNQQATFYHQTGQHTQGSHSPQQIPVNKEQGKLLEEKDPNSNKKSKNKAKMKMIYIVGLIIVIGLVAGIYIMSKKNENLTTSEYINNETNNMEFQEPAQNQQQDIPQTMVPEITPEEEEENLKQEIQSLTEQANNLYTSTISTAQGVVTALEENESEEGIEVYALAEESIIEIEQIQDLISQVNENIELNFIEEAYNLANQVHDIANVASIKASDALSKMQEMDEFAVPQEVLETEEVLEEEAEEAVEDTVQEEEEEEEEETEETEEEEDRSANNSSSTNSNNSISTNGNNSSSSNNSSNSTSNTHVCDYKKTTEIIKNAWTESKNITQEVNGAYFATTGEWVSTASGEAELVAYINYLNSEERDTSYIAQSRTIVTGSEIINHPAETKTVYKCSCGKTR